MTRRGSEAESRERRSKGDENVGSPSDEDKEAGVEEVDEGRKESTGVWNKIRRGRRWLRWFLTLERFHMAIIILVVSSGLCLRGRFQCERRNADFPF